MKPDDTATPPELTVLFGYFPRAIKTGREANRMWVDLLRKHPADVVRAVLHSHRLERKGNDPCIATVKGMLSEAARQFESKSPTGQSRGEHETLRALRAWAIQGFGNSGREMSGRELVERRIRAEWDNVPESIRQTPGSEINTEQYRVLFAMVGVPEREADAMILGITGCHPIQKYDHLTREQLVRQLSRTVPKIEAKVTPARTTEATTIPAMLCKQLAAQVAEREGGQP